MAPSRTSTPVVCDICHKTISRKADLPRHMKTHAENKEELMYACDYPGCTFKTLQRSNLLTHLDVHLRKRPHKCPEEGCGFRCSDPGSLTRHRRGRHGHQVEGSRSSASTRKAARQQRKVSPYSTSSSSSRSATRTGSPCDPPSNTHPSPSSVLSLSDEQVEGNINNACAEYSAEPVTKRVQVNDAQLAPSAPSFTSSLGVFIASEESVADHSQLQIPEQGDLYAVDAASQQISERTSSDDASNDFYTQFNGLPPAGPSLPMPLVAYGMDNLAPAPLPSPVATYTPDNAVLSTPASWMLPSYDVHYAVNNEPLPTLLPAKTSLAHPPYEVQYTLNSAPSNYEYYGYTQATEAAPFEAQFNLSQPDSWATPDMSVGVYPQVSYPRTVGVDQGYQSYSYPTTTYPATAESTFGMQGFYA